MGQRVQTESQEQRATVDSCFNLVRYRQHGAAAKSKATSWQTDRPLNAYGNKLRCLPIGHCHNAKCMTLDNKQNPEYHVTVEIKTLETDKYCATEKTWPNHEYS